jgi:trimethylamine--corrinoid protein Co-methyltransferase
MSDTDTKRNRRGGRERRDPHAKPAAPAYITRAIPTYDILDEENLRKIEAAADRILAEVGLDIRDDDECLAMFRRSGAQVDGMRVRFEPGHLREILKTAPRVSPSMPAIPARSVQIGGNSVVFSPAYGSPFVMDLDRGRRYGTLEDFQNFIKLAYACPWLHHSGGTVCEPTDVPVNKRHLDMVYAHMRYSDKAYMGSITSEERAEDSIAMSRLLFGADFVDKNCVILGNVNVNSPLLWDGTMTKSARAYARANQAAVIVPFILGGAMGPVTNAGAIAQAHAETMVGCAITQLERPGAPVIYGNFLSSMSLRSGSPTFGTPEPAIGSMVSASSRAASACRCAAPARSPPPSCPTARRCRRA